MQTKHTGREKKKKHVNGGPKNRQVQRRQDRGKKTKKRKCPKRAAFDTKKGGVVSGLIGVRSASPLQQGS